jgi:hypothetical protein
MLNLDHQPSLREAALALREWCDEAISLTMHCCLSAQITSMRLARTFIEAMI